MDSPLTVVFEGTRCAAEGGELGARALRLVSEAAPASGLSARAVVSHEAPLTLDLTLLRDGSELGSRTLVGASCDELVDAAALVLALAVDPEAAASMVGEAEDPVVPDESVPSDGGVIAPKPTPDAGPVSQRLAAALSAPGQRGARAPHGSRSAARLEPARSRGGDLAAVDPSGESDGDRERPALAPSFGLGAVLDVGALPRAAFGLSVRVGINVGPLRLEASGTYLPEQEVAFAQHPTARGRFGLAVGALGACVPFRLGPIVTGPCAGLEVGAAWASSSGVSDPGAATDGWVAPFAGALFAVDPASWLRLRMDLGLTVPVLAPEFIVDGIGTVHEPGAATFRLGIGAEVHFR